MSLETISINRSFEGWHQRHRHTSQVNHCTMTFAIYLPPQASLGKVPVLYWLSGLTCTDENFMQKAGAHRIAAALGVAIVVPDTSPRGEDVPDAGIGEYDLGQGAGFCLNATRAPWKHHYQMYDYIVHELPRLIEANFPVTRKRAISGHSMGGHGALMIGLRNPEQYQSISAFSPIVNPAQSPWGIKAFSNYLGEDQAAWQQYDSCFLIAAADPSRRLPVLIDQGDQDEFLSQQLMPDHFRHSADQADYPVTIRMQAGYDHSYYFIASFIEDHLRFHARYLIPGNV